MKLINKYKGSKYDIMNEYYCEIASILDNLANIDPNSHWRHYIVVDDYCIKERCLAIRIPGGTVGGIWINRDNVITKIVLDTKYVVKTYPDDVNEQIKRFVGEKIEFNEDIKENEEIS